MRLAVSGLVLFCLGGVALPDAAVDPHAKEDPSVKAAATHLEKGLKELARVPSLETDAARLQALDRAILSLRRARNAAVKGEGNAFDLARREIDTENALVRALVGQTEIYLVRKSLPLAKEKNAEALAIRPMDMRALALADFIAEAEAADLYEPSAGAPAIQRIRGRRAASGMPVRDRGASGRR